MATVVQLEGMSAPISLYIDLAQGRRGDIEVISRAAIAWSEAIREAAFLTDPFLEVRVELVSGTDGSIDLNSLIRAIKGVVTDPKKLKAIGLAVAMFFARDAVDWVKGKGYDALWDWANGEYAQLVDDFSETDKRETEELIAKIASSKSAQQKARKVYQELQRDDAVTGVGVSFTPGKRPTDIVPRSEFAERGGVPGVQEETIERRTMPDRVTLTLISPALSEDDLKWKFQLGSRTLWAVMEDPVFKGRFRPGSNSAPRMVIGIRMDVDIAIVQEMREGVWHNVEQRITHVHSLNEPVQQPAWLDAPSKPPKSQQDGD